MQDVIFKVKADLGPEAVIVNKRKFKKGGLFGFFGKEMFEVVAALEAKSAALNNTDNAEAKENKDEQVDDVIEISNYGRNAKKVDRNKIQKTASKDPENKNAIKEFITDLKTAADAAEEKEKVKTSNGEKKNNFRQELNEHRNNQQQSRKKQKNQEQEQQPEQNEKIIQNDINKNENLQEKKKEKNGQNKKEL